MPGPRCIVREPRFEEELRNLQPDSQQADEMLRALEWALSRAPEDGCPADDAQIVYTRNLREFGSGLPSFTVYYAFDDSRVWLLSIQHLSDLEL